MLSFYSILALVFGGSFFAFLGISNVLAVLWCSLPPPPPLCPSFFYGPPTGFFQTWALCFSPVLSARPLSQQLCQLLASSLSQVFALRVLALRVLAVPDSISSDSSLVSASKCHMRLLQGVPHKKTYCSFTPASLPRSPSPPHSFEGHVAHPSPRTCPPARRPYFFHWRPARCRAMPAGYLLCLPAPSSF